MSSKMDFLRQQAPANYVAGLGRGATGFTTRSDIGPAKDGPTEEMIKAALERRQQAQEGYVPQGEKEDEDEDEDRFKDAEDEAGLFSSAANQDQEDDEADRVWRDIDDKLEKRREKSKQARELKENEEYSRKNPTIADQFADAKRGLAAVTDEEWANIPEVGDLTGKNKRRQNLRERTYAVPDSLFQSALQKSQFDSSIDVGTQNGLETPMTSKQTDFTQFSESRERLLGSSLDNLRQGTDSVYGSTNIDPKGYMTSLQSMSGGNNSLGDIKRARQLLQAVVKANPTNADGWIACARLEETAGRIVEARKMIKLGCSNCPEKEDVWLENVRLNTIENGRIICGEAVKHVPRSVKLWLTAMELETDIKSKKRVLMKALTQIRQSVQLWKKLVNLEENPVDARLLLAQAVEEIPLSVELWLALARLENYENAKKVLNKARKAIKTSHEIWIAAVRLEEQSGHEDRVDKLMQRAIRDLENAGGMISQEEWLKEAEKCEHEGGVLTCQAIVKATLGHGVEEEDRKSSWMDDAQNAIANGSFDTARAIYAYALSVFPDKKSIWRRAAELEKHYGNKETLYGLLAKAVEACPHAESLWLMYAKETWLGGDVQGSRKILEAAFEQNANNEDIWLAAVKLEAENGQFDSARILLERARQEAESERVWKKSVVLERELGNNKAALNLVDQGLRVYEGFDKLWMMKGQIYEDMGKTALAREAYSQGLKKCPKSVPLWILAARLEEKVGAVGKARTLLDQSRLKNPKNAVLWTESVRVEARAGNGPQARMMMSKGLQECPRSGLLLAEDIFMQARQHRKNRSADALKLVDNDPVLISAVARWCFTEHKAEKGRKWFEHAIKSNPDYGDAWAWWYRLETEEIKKEEIVERCVRVEPKHGEHWQEVAKRPENARKGVHEVLNLVAKSLV